MSHIVSASEESIREAAGILKAGGLVGMPTETVYGLAGNALDGAAVARIFAAKGRPGFNPLIVHLYSSNLIELYADLGNAGLKAQVSALADKFWPGPLTLILPRKKNCPVSELATAGLPTIALRVPGHKIARQLLEVSGVPLAAPSANVSGSLSPTNPAHVAESLGDKVDMILAAGACAVGLESTVLDLSGDEPVILRPGAVSAEEIGDTLNAAPPSYYILHNLNKKKEGFLGSPDSNQMMRPKSPGQLLKHYAPETKLRLNAVDIIPGEALLGFGSLKFMGVKGGGAAGDLPEHMLRNLSEEGDLYEAAANLFAMLKELDKAGAEGIAVMNIPDTGLGIAINDRLKRAAS